MLDTKDATCDLAEIFSSKSEEVIAGVDGASFTLATADVALELTLSAVHSPSV